MKFFFIRLRSFDKSLLNQGIGNLLSLLSKKQIVQSSISLPRKKKSFTLLRSPHVNKFSREQLEMRTYSRLIKIQIEDFINQEEFLKELKNSCPSGITLKLLSEQNLELVHINQEIERGIQDRLMEDLHTRFKGNVYLEWKNYLEECLKKNKTAPSIEKDFEKSL